jgi:hypothetical protein
MRGETGRCMFQPDLEADAFGDIPGFPTAAAATGGGGR